MAHEIIPVAKRSDVLENHRIAHTTPPPPPITFRSNIVRASLQLGEGGAAWTAAFVLRISLARSCRCVGKRQRLAALGSNSSATSAWLESLLHPAEVEHEAGQALGRPSFMRQPREQPSENSFDVGDIFQHRDFDQGNYQQCYYSN